VPHSLNLLQAVRQYKHSAMLYYLVMAFCCMATTISYITCNVYIITVMTHFDFPMPTSKF